MYVDASAIVAILTVEVDCDRLVDALDGADAAITSPIAVFEATMGLARKHRLDLHTAHQVVEDFLVSANVSLVAVTLAEAALAVDAAARYGKGRGHPAQLNLGDCFAYAAARASNSPILFTGEDFTKTDLRAA